MAAVAWWLWILQFCPDYNQAFVPDPSARISAKEGPRPCPHDLRVNSASHGNQARVSRSDACQGGRTTFLGDWCPVLYLVRFTVQLSGQQIFLISSGALPQADARQSNFAESGDQGTTTIRYVSSGKYQDVVWFEFWHQSSQLG